MIQFNEAINSKNISKLSDFMHESYKFIDTMGHVENGKQKGIENWKRFFEMFPDYINHFEKITKRDEMVIILGFSTCSDRRLQGKAIWTAKFENDLIIEWRIYDYTDELFFSISG